MTQCRPATILVHMNREPVDAFGEVFMRLPFLRALREWAPKARITIIPGFGGMPLWETHMGPLTRGLVNEIIHDALPGPERRFDWVFDMEGHVPTARRLRRLARRRFYSTALRGWFHLPHLPIYHGKHVAKRYLGLLGQATGAKSMPSSLWPWPVPENYRAAAARLLPDGGDYIALAPGAGVKGTGKCWPVERYAEVARRQTALGRVPVILLSVGERGWEERFNGIPGARFPLMENRPEETGVPSDPVLTVALAERVRAAVANCSGTGHMLALGGAPLVSLFGPSSAKKFHPLARAGIHLFPTTPGGKNIAEIEVDAVLAVVDKLHAAHFALRPPVSSTASS